MLSKEDYKNYLNQVSKLENDMAIFYKDCSDNVSDNFIKETCRKLLEEEKKHVLIVEEVKSLFNV